MKFANLTANNESKPGLVVVLSGRDNVPFLTTVTSIAWFYLDWSQVFSKVTRCGIDREALPIESLWKTNPNQDPSFTSKGF